MSWITTGIKWIMLVSGLLTGTMFHTAVAPRTGLRSMFGEALDGPLAQVVVRSRGALIGLVGLMLIHGAFAPPVRRLVLGVAGVSKAVFGLVLACGRDSLGRQVGVAVDSVMVAPFAAYLLGARDPAGRRQP